MRLTSADKKIVKAFLNRDPGEKSSKKLWTDGTRLDGLWMGGANIAEWKAGKLHFRGYDSRSQQAVAKAVVKEAPIKWMERVIHPESEWALPRKRNTMQKNVRRARGTTAARYKPRQGDYTVDFNEVHRLWWARKQGVGALNARGYASMDEAIERASDEAFRRGERRKPVFVDRGEGWEVVAEVPLKRGRNEGHVRSTKKRNPSHDVPVFATGDRDPFTHGGGLVYYQPEYDDFLWAFWDEPLEEQYPEIEDAVYRVHHFRYGPNEDLFSPTGSLSWALVSIHEVADSMGMEASELRRLGRGNFIEKLMAAEAVRDYYGAENLDSYPFEESHRELLKRYEKDHRKVVDVGAEQAVRRVDSLRMGRRRNTDQQPVRKLKNRLMR